MKVAKVAGEGEELQTLSTPLESQEAMLPPTEDREMSVTGARCSLYSSCPSTRYFEFFFASTLMLGSAF